MKVDGKKLNFGYQAARCFGKYTTKHILLDDFYSESEKVGAIKVWKFNKLFVIWKSLGKFDICYCYNTVQIQIFVQIY